MKLVADQKPGSGLLLTVTDKPEGEDIENLKTRIRSLGLEGRVHLSTDLSHGQYLRSLSQADAFIRATLSDGDALSVREAMSLGTQVIAYDTGQRPSGSRLFSKRDPRSLADAMLADIASKEPETHDKSFDFRRFLELYEREARQG